MPITVKGTKWAYNKHLLSKWMDNFISIPYLKKKKITQLVHLQHSEDNALNNFRFLKINFIIKEREISISDIQKNESNSKRSSWVVLSIFIDKWVSVYINSQGNYFELYNSNTTLIGASCIMQAIYLALT